MGYSYTTLMQQSRCAALGFWPGPIDGILGSRTRAALRDAAVAQADLGKPFIHPSGLSQIRWHWTGGADKPNATDMKHYHRLVDGEAKIIKAHDLTKRLSHTLNANRGAIALSLCGMSGANERPFIPGDYPITPAQIAALAKETAVLALEYDIPITRWSVMSHAEVQLTLGIQQRRKWDITWAPGMHRPGNPINVGDALREMTRSILEKKGARHG